MRLDLRDRLEILKFDATEKTLGSCLRAIIRRLQKEQHTAGDHHKQPNPSHPDSKDFSR